VHTLLLVLHVVLSIFLIGPLVAAANQAARSLRRGDTGALRMLSRAIAIYGWASLAAAVSGLVLVRDDYHAEFSDGWLISSIVLFVVASVLVLGLLVPMLRAATPTATVTATAAGAGAGAGAAAGTAETRSVAPRVAAVGGLASLCYVVIAVLMVWQPH